MGLDLYIEAKITEKGSKKCISVSNDPFLCPESDEDNYWFNVIWLFGQHSFPVRESLIDIVNRYTGNKYTCNDFEMPFPQSALREMCSCLFGFCCTPEEQRFEYHLKKGFGNISSHKKPCKITYSEYSSESCDWDEHQGDEMYFLHHALRLRGFIYLLDRIHYENEYIPLVTDDSDIYYPNVNLVDDCICKNSDLERLRENPQAYEWAFRIYNSY